MPSVSMDSRSSILISTNTNKEPQLNLNISGDNVEIKGIEKEVDPTVPAWAKSETKPQYTAEEVGALPSDTFIPSRLEQLDSDAEHRTVSDEEKDNWNSHLFSGNYEDLEGKPENLSDFNNDVGFITEYIETDPTVPAWAKEENKPSYTAEEVGALPSTTVVPTRLSDLDQDDAHLTVSKEEKLKWNSSTGFSGDYNDLLNKPTEVSNFNNDVGYLTEETDPTVPDWAKEENKPTYTASEVGALPVGTFIPSALSELDNDLEKVTADDIDAMWRGDYNE